jgi:hypothetical protein
MKNGFYIVMLGFMLVACEKDKLINEYAVLKGKWVWIYTQHSYELCPTISEDPDLLFETITPSTDPNTYAVEFLEKGKLWFYENDEVIQKDRIVFSYFEYLSNGEYHFYIRLDNKADEMIGGSLSGDTLRFKYPYIEDDPNCENYLNFFVRE